MGNKSSSRPDKYFLHPRLGQLGTLTTKDKVHMLFTTAVQNDEQLRQWQADVAQARTFPEAEAILLPVSFDASKVPCGSSYDLKIQYPYFPYSLETEIKNRAEHSTMLTEPELSYLVYQLCLVSRDFAQHSTSSGNIKPNNVFINEGGEIKVLSRYSFPNFHDAYNSALFDKQRCLLAPEEMANLAKSNYEPKIDLSRAQAFSISMTGLSAAVLEDMHSCYNFKNGAFDVELLQKHLTNFCNNPRYSSIIKQVIKRMLVDNPKDRMSVEEACAFLSPYDFEIKGLQEYTPNMFLCESALTEYRNRGLATSSNNNNNVLTSATHPLVLHKGSAQIIGHKNSLPQSQNHQVFQSNIALQTPSKPEEKPVYHKLQAGTIDLTPKRASRRTNSVVSNLQPNPVVNRPVSSHEQAPVLHQIGTAIHHTPFVPPGAVRFIPQQPVQQIHHVFSPVSNQLIRTPIQAVYSSRPSSQYMIQTPVVKLQSTQFVSFDPVRTTAVANNNTSTVPGNIVFSYNPTNDSNNQFNSLNSGFKKDRTVPASSPRVTNTPGDGIGVGYAEIVVSQLYGRSGYDEHQLNQSPGASSQRDFRKGDQTKQ